MTGEQDADAVYRYRSIEIDAQPGNRLEEVANRMGRQGWRLVEYDDQARIAIFEKKDD